MSTSRVLLREDMTERARDAFRSAMPTSWRATPGLDEAARPDHWSRAVRPDLQGVENLWQITERFYRSGQPTAEGFRALEDFGIRTVISMRQTVNDVPLAAGTGLALVRIPMKSRHVAEHRGDKIVRTMRVLRKSMAQGPVLLHCRHGSDRTGVIVALWRILYEGWSRQAALDELIAGGYGYHAIWANIPRYVRKVDLRDLRARIEG
jgi:protein tyrosine/serine phosphatase